MNRKQDVWYAIPAADVEESRGCLEAWRDMGYRTAALTDDGTNPDGLDVGSDFSMQIAEYAGYPNAVNTLCRRLIDQFDATLIATGGYDIFPDPNKRADEIAAEFREHFPDGFGVMQPTGDRWMPDASGRVASERICGSPWLGKAFIERINGGAGPFWPEYFHFFCDEEMHDVTESLGILWQRPDLTQRHEHWSRDRGNRGRPDYLQAAHNQCVEAKNLFDRRKAAGFPGSAPIAAEVLG